MDFLSSLYQGRINRVKFLYGFIVVKALDIFFFGGANIEWNALVIAIVIFQVLFGSVIAAKRLHDFGFSGWFSIFFLIPLVGFFVGLALLFTKGDVKTNQYGPVPN